MSRERGIIGNGDEARLVVAILRTVGITELFIPKELLADAFGNKIMFVHEHMQKDGFLIKIGESNDT